MNSISGIITLKACRYNADLSAEELAKKLGITSTTVYNWENGITKISYTNLKELSVISNVPIELIKAV